MPPSVTTLTYTNRHPGRQGGNEQAHEGLLGALLEVRPRPRDRGLHTEEILCSRHPAGPSQGLATPPASEAPAVGTNPSDRPGRSARKESDTPPQMDAAAASETSNSSPVPAAAERPASAVDPGLAEKDTGSLSPGSGRPVIDDNSYVTPGQREPPSQPPFPGSQDSDAVNWDSTVDRLAVSEGPMAPSVDRGALLRTPAPPPVVASADGLAPLPSSDETAESASVEVMCCDRLETKHTLPRTSSGSDDRGSTTLKKKRLGVEGWTACTTP
ncbi:hypothetical protein HPB47_021095 [Ixodes persulcatus]|uniref:Uncharacterized protein n=1 Tax=Ixodes persulcatus TaxID=34615 RepID=A0AC60QDK1_IXOPE|nr:hypothetical protein HPB47_021095 [Ixodes persulcatus]